MNMFGSFSFGNLIKTFLPGFVWLCVFAMLELLLGGTNSWVRTELTSARSSIFVLAIPLSILAGLISNIFMFFGGLDRLVRNPVKEREKEKWGLFEALSAQLKSECCNNFDCGDSVRQLVHKTVDAEIVLLNKIGVEKAVYVREQYWYYLEFCLNLFTSLVAMTFISIVVFFLKVGFNWSLASWGWGFVIIWLIAICFLLLKAARKNYERHLDKTISLLIVNLKGTGERDMVLETVAGSAQKFLVKEIK